MAESIERLIHRDYWNGHRVEVIDKGNLRSLYFGSSYLQSCMSLDTPHTLVLSYTQYMILGLLLNRCPENILVIGVGSGSLLRFLHYHLPNSHIDAVDYSPHIIHLAKGYFYLPESPKIQVHCADGFEFMQQLEPEQYDLILIDAFDGRGMAPTIYQLPLFDLCNQTLKEKGVASFNLWSSNKPKFQHIRIDLANSFCSCLFLPVPERGNIVTLCTRKPFPANHFYRSKKELKLLSEQYQLDFVKMVKTAKKNNFSISEKVKSIFR